MITERIASNTPSSIKSSSSALNVLWWGTTQGEYGWVADRIRSYQPVGSEFFVGDSKDSGQVFRHLEHRRIDRIVVAQTNRCHYPASEFLRLACEYPEIPVALCLGDYWLGWRRSGFGHLQTLQHCSFHWYRWFDGWLPWLQGVRESVFGPFPSDRLQQPTALDLLDNGESQGPVILFCADNSMAQSWQIALQGANQSMIVVSGDVELWARSMEGQPSGRIIWDDSRMVTWNGRELGLQLAQREIAIIKNACPTSKLWLCLTSPSWQDWLALADRAPRVELLAKPHLLSFSSAALCRT